MNSDEEHHSLRTTVNQFPAKRKRRYFKEGGELRRKKCHKRSVLSTQSHPSPSSSPNLVVCKGGSTSIIHGPVSPGTPISVIQVSDGKILDDYNDKVKSPGKTPTPGYYRRLHVALPAASNRGFSHISGAMVPFSSIGSNSSNMSIHSSPAFIHNLPSMLETAEILTSRNSQGRSA